MAKRLLPPDWHVTKDNGDPATDATLSFRLGGSSTATPVWFDPDLTEPTTAGVSSISCDATGYPSYSGNDVAIWGADDVTYDCVVAATGYNGGASKTLENLAVADTAISDAANTESDFINALPNGAFQSWSGGTSFSNVSGDNDGDEVADGWFFAQPSAASNAVSRQAGSAVGTAPARARYALRFGRPAASTSTNKMRLWSMLPTDEVYRMRSQSVTVSFTAKKGADFSGTSLAVKLATGTSEGEDGDLIESDGLGGHSNVISQTITPSTSAQRFEITVTVGSTIAEMGVQFSYTGVGTAGSNDWVQIEDVQIEIGAAATSFQHIPEPIDWLRGNLSTLGRLFAGWSAADPNADRIVFWDDSAGGFTYLAASTGISISGTNITVDQSFSPQWSGTHQFPNTGLTVLDTNASHALTIKPGSDITAARTLTLTTGDADRTLDISAGSVTISAAAATVLDDASVGAMCTTLGAAQLGGSNTFTGQNKIQNTGASAVYLEIQNQYFTYRWGFNASAYPGLHDGSGTSIFYYDTNNLATTFNTGDVRINAAPSALAVNSAGFRGAPLGNGGSAANSAYTLVLADAGCTIYHDEVTARTYTIPANASVAYPIGTTIIIDNTGNSGSAGSITLSITSDTLRRGDGVSGTGSRTIAAGAVAVIRKTKSTEWVICGTFS